MGIGAVKRSLQCLLMSMRATISTLALYNQTLRLQPRQAKPLGYVRHAPRPLTTCHIGTFQYGVMSGNWQFFGNLGGQGQFVLTVLCFVRVGERQNPAFVWHSEYRYFEAPTEQGTAKRDTVSVHINSPSKRHLDIHITPIDTSQIESLALLKQAIPRSLRYIEESERH